jgi:hypothetical protein
MGLRNELRPALTGAPNLQPYTWATWKTYLTAAASAIHSANPDVLIYFSGLESDFNIEPAVGGSTLLDLGFSFNVASYEWAHKLVFEMHEYDEGISISCPVYEAILEGFGADATTRTTGNRAPLVISNGVMMRRMLVMRGRVHIVSVWRNSWFRGSWGGWCGS